MPPESPLPPLQTGDGPEDGRCLCEEGAQAAHRGFGPAPPGTSGGQVPAVLEGSRGARATEEALLAGQVRVALTALHSAASVVTWGWAGSPPGEPRALTRLCPLPLSYLCFRLLGAALPLLSKEQLQLVMRGDLIDPGGIGQC